MIVYISCPSWCTGGPHALHQLSHTLLRLGVDSRMVYYPNTLSGKDRTTIMPAYQTKYPGLRLVETILDSPENILIIGESSHRKKNNILRETLQRYSRMRVWMYWLSYDFGDPINFFEHNRVRHFAQCEYIESRLHSIDPKIPIRWLSDFTTQRFVDQMIERLALGAQGAGLAAAGPAVPTRKKQVLYNPAKDQITPQLFPDAIPIRGMTSDQVNELMWSSMVYCDFGHHPGKDRMPREAACCGLVVVVNRKGAASELYQDIPGVVRRFDPTDPEEVKQLVSFVGEVFGSWELYCSKMEPYREQIRNEYPNYVLETRKAFDLPLVDFLVIGLQKAGTSWLHTVLEQNKEVGLSAQKEVHYFDWNLKKGPSWYESNFEEASNRTPKPLFYGEITPDYIALSQKRVWEVYRYNPNIRLIVIERNAVDRAWSCLRMEIRNGTFPEPSLFSGSDETPPTEASEAPTEEMMFRRMTSNMYVERGDLATGIRKYLKCFSRKQITILRYRDIQNRPESVKSTLYRAIGASDIKVSETVLSKNRQISSDRRKVQDAEKNKVQMSPELHRRVSEFYSTIQAENEQIVERFIDGSSEK